MKKNYYFAALGLLVASCASDEIVDTATGYKPATDTPISFVTHQKNITRASQPFQKAGHYNFGVFAYKSTETVNEIMANYLVGYNDPTNNVGYYMTAADQTTLGDPDERIDGQSYWQYEKLGYADYTYAGEGFYKASQTAYMSNVDNQYLRFWDLAAPTTSFYAYAPYIKEQGSVKTVTYVDGTAQAATGNDTYVMTFPDGTIIDGYNNADLLEYMYATNKIAKADYGKDVPLDFKRLNAKVDIKFWEDIAGYSVRILDLKEGTNEGVQAAASIKDGSSNKYGYKGGKYYSANGAKIQFPAPGATTPTAPVVKQFKGTVENNTRPLVFAAPTAAAIGTNRVDASPSATTYYAIPKGQGANLLAGTSTDFSDNGTAEDSDFALTGFTFHVSYELTSTTGERIIVKNATVHVPATYCNWAPNTHYTYVFKITKNSNGSTDPADDSNIDPTDPEVPTENGLYPIVFDNCTIADYDKIETEYIINEGVKNAYYDVQLLNASDVLTYSITNEGTLKVNIVQINDYTTPGATNTNEPDYTNITVTKADGTTDANVTYNSTTKEITISSGAAGQYVVTYTCANADIDATHPRTWTETFWVGNAYTLALNLNEVGTHGLANSKLAITAKMDGTSVTPAAANLYINYPENFTAAEKDLVKVVGSEIVVDKTAKPGVYELVYTVDEGNGVVGDKKTFTVVDYQFALNSTVVYLNGDQTVMGNKTADGDHVYTVTKLTGTSDLSINSTTKNQVDVPATTAEGTYKVTYTLYGSSGNTNAVSTVQYEQVFEVRNAHSVTLNANSMDRDKGTSTSGAYSTDVKTITTTQNGSATTTDLSSKLSVVKADNTDTTTGDFKITYSGSGNSYKLEVKNTVAPANYRIKFVSTVAGADKAEYFDFVVTE